MCSTPKCATPLSKLNRRSRVRHKLRKTVHLSLGRGPESEMLDLNEILNISEEGLALRSFVPLQAGNEIKV
jgi:hypothetical protein